MTERPPTEFERVCLPHLKDCHSFALSLTRRDSDADDLVQETYLRAFTAFGSFQRGTNCKAWLFTILRRLHIDRHRRARVRPQVLAEAPLEDSGLSPMAEPPEAVSQQGWERLPPQAVRAAIEQIPEAFRLAVVLRDLHGLSYAQIGEILDVPPGTVMSRLHRGREYARQALVPLLRQPPTP